MPRSGNAQVACVVPTLPGGAAQKGQLYQRHAFRFKADPVPGFKLVPLSGRIARPGRGTEKSIGRKARLMGRCLALCTSREVLPLPIRS